MILNAVDAGTGDAPPLVLLHGLFGHSGNFTTLQKRIARSRRVLALDLRNHGASGHAAGMRYVDMAEDVLETLRARKALPAIVLGHSMGGKTAMAAALLAPAAVTRLIVADIAPVPYQHGMRAYVDAMAAIPLRPGLTRAEADAALAPTVANPGVRGFLLQNLRTGASPAWRVGLPEIAAAMPAIEGWEAIDEPPYPGPTLFIGGARSDYIRPEDRGAIRALFPAARFVTLKDAGHWLHADNPEGFAALIESAIGGT